MLSVTEGDSTGTALQINENKQRYQMWFAIMDDPQGWGASIHWDGITQRLNAITDPAKLAAHPAMMHGCLPNGNRPWAWCANYFHNRCEKWIWCERTGPGMNRDNCNVCGERWPDWVFIQKRVSSLI